MDLKKLEYFESVYRLQSFSKAAAEHYISQPSISNAIRSLEEELGITLVARNTKPLSLTMDGMRFMDHVYRILGDVHNAQAEARSIAAEQQRQIHVLYHSTLGDWVIRKITMDFSIGHPQYQVITWEALGNQMLYMLRHDDMDIAYTIFPSDLNTDLFECIPVIECEYHVLLPNDHPLLEKEVLSPEDLKDETILTFPKGSEYYRNITSMFSKHRLQPTIFTPGPINVISQLVHEGQGISIITKDPLSGVDSMADFETRPLTERTRLTKGFIMKKERRSRHSLSTLVRYVREEKAKMMQQLTGRETVATDAGPSGI